MIGDEIHITQNLYFNFWFRAIIWNNDNNQPSDQSCILISIVAIAFQCTLKPESMAIKFGLGLIFMD